MLQGEQEDGAKGGGGVKNGGVDVGMDELHGFLLSLLGPRWAR